MANSQQNQPNQDYQDALTDMYEDDNTVILKEGINMNELCNPEGKGVHFEVDEEGATNVDEIKFDSKDIYEQGNAQSLDAFDGLLKDMEKLTDDGGVRKRVLVQGDGLVVPDGVQVIVHYNGYLEYNDEPYDSTYLRKSPLKYVLGCQHMISGLEIGIRTMKKNETANILVSPDYAFGPRGVPPRVPANAKILFEVTLIKWVECNDLHDFYKLSWAERQSCDVKLLEKVAGHFLKEGNEKANQGKFVWANKEYMKAVKMMEPFRPKDEEAEGKWKKILVRVYSNIAHCHLKLCNLGSVVRFSREALSLDPDHVKALFRRGKAYRKMSEFDKAMKDLNRARSLDPTSREISKELQELEETKKMFKSAEKRMYERMFAPSKNEAKAAGNVNKENCTPNVKETTEAELETSDDFKNTVNCQLKAFVEDHSLMEYPLPSVKFSDAELSYIIDAAGDLSLDHAVKGEGSNVHVRLYKKKPEGEF